MDIEKAKEAYETLKRNNQVVANIDKDFFLNFAETVLNELEKKDKRINDLEYSLLDMVMQFANRVKTKGCSYALDTMGLSSLETAFSELDFDDPMPVSKAEEKYKILEKQYFEKVEGK